jgi:hypothetical protein
MTRFVIIKRNAFVPEDETRASLKFELDHKGSLQLF